ITTNNSGNASFNFNGGTLKAANNSANFVDLGGANQNAYVLSGGAVIDSNGFNVTIPQALQDGGGGGGLTKTGAGSLSLTAANNPYTGPTNITAGRLVVTGSLSATSGVNISAGAYFNA